MITNFDRLVQELQKEVTADSIVDALDTIEKMPPSLLKELFMDGMTISLMHLHKKRTDV